MAELAPVARQRFFDSNGDPLVGGLLYTYEAGTNTPRATYKDFLEAEPNTNPIVLDSSGYAEVRIISGSYKFVLKDSSDVTIWTEDNVQSLASLISVAGALAVDSNLSDLNDPATARVNIGFGSVDNTSDVDKPVSTAQQSALDLKADIASPTFTGTVGGITKSMVGLGSVDNTSDATKNIATATLENKTINADDNIITNIENDNIKSSANIARSKLAPATVDRALINNGSGNITASAVTTTELERLSGVTSSVQTQLDAKAPLTSPSLTNPLTNLMLLTEGTTPSTPSSGVKALYANTDGKLYTVDDTGTETEVGSGAGGGGKKNFITNSDFEDNTSTGWATYADSADTRPVDGDSGTPNITISPIASTNIAGDYLLRVSKDSSNRQGEGVSYDFTVDKTYQAKVLDIEFDYLISSGDFVAGSNGVESDVIVYIYDVTNTTLIEPSSISLFSNSSTLTGNFKASFQTAPDSTSYRLILHVASTSTDAYDLDIDEVKVSPSSYVYGTPISDWTDAGPVTITGTTTSPTKGTTTVDKLWWRRVGSDAEIRLEYHQSTSGTSGTGDYLFKMPSGLSIDTSKVEAYTGVEGSGAFKVTNTVGSASFSYEADGGGIGVVSVYDSDEFRIIGMWSNGTNHNRGYLSSSFFGMSLATLGYTASFTVPISGWSSRVQMSDTTSGRIIAVSGSNTSSQSIPNSVSTKLTNWTFNDSSGGFDGTTDEYTIQEAGYYLIQLQSSYYKSGSYHSDVQIYINGVSQGRRLMFSYNAGYDTHMNPSLSRLLDLKAGDTVGFYTLQNSGTSEAIESYTYFSIVKINGASSISETETISMRASGNPASASSGTAIKFPTEIWDTHNSYDSATGLFTAPAFGYYTITTAFTSPTTSIIINSYKNGTLDGYMDTTSASGTISTSIDVKANAGDTLSIRPSGTINITDGVLSIKRVK